MLKKIRINIAEVQAFEDKQFNWLIGYFFNWIPMRPFAITNYKNLRNDNGLEKNGITRLHKLLKISESIFL